MNNLIYYVTRGLWSFAGIGNIVIAVTANTDSILMKVFVFLTGVITLLLSILFGAFLRHITGHEKDREALFKELSNYTRQERCNDRYGAVLQRLDDIKSAVCNKD